MPSTNSPINPHTTSPSPSAACPCLIEPAGADGDLCCSLCMCTCSLFLQLLLPGSACWRRPGQYMLHAYSSGAGGPWANAAGFDEGTGRRVAAWGGSCPGGWAVLAVRSKQVCGRAPGLRLLPVGHAVEFVVHAARRFGVLAWWCRTARATARAGAGWAPGGRRAPGTHRVCVGGGPYDTG